MAQLSSISECCSGSPCKFRSLSVMPLCFFFHFFFIVNVMFSTFLFKRSSGVTPKVTTRCVWYIICWEKWKWGLQSKSKFVWAYSSFFLSFLIFCLNVKTVGCSQVSGYFDHEGKRIHIDNSFKLRKFSSVSSLVSLLLITTNFMSNL